MTMYALEHRGRTFIAAFALGCVLSSAYGFVSGAWPFGVVELVWAAVALRRFFTTPSWSHRDDEGERSRGPISGRADCSSHCHSLRSAP